MSSTPPAHHHSTTPSQSPTVSSWVALSQPQPLALAQSTPRSPSQTRLAPDYNPSLNIMDLDDGSELSGVDEEFLEQYESEQAGLIKQQELGLRSPESFHTAPVDRADDVQMNGDEFVNASQEHGEDSIDRKEKDDGEFRRYLKKSKDISPRSRDRLRDGLRVRDQPAMPAAKSTDVTDQIGYQPEIRTRIKFTKKNLWSNPRTPAYDVTRMLMSEECLAPDHLLRRPTPSFKYVTTEGKVRDAPQYDWDQSKEERKIVTGHPKYAAYLKNWDLKEHKEALLYWNFMPKEHDYPLAGKPESSEVRDFNLTMSSNAENDLTKGLLQEEAFNARPSIRLPIPDHIKAILVDDWENVTKNQQLVPLPAIHTVDSILDDYMAFEKPKRQAGTNQAELLEEVVMGLKEYFEKCLGRILLYRFERQQYLEVREAWNAVDGELKGLSAVTTYGAEHFCRLLVSLPELLAQTNMDQQSCNRLCEELAKLTIWLGRNAFTYFRSEYETPGPSYIDKARNG